MNVWLIHLAEPLPCEPGRRLMRYGILGEMLAERGHRVVQWAATFDHFSKQQRYTSDTSLAWRDNYAIELLFAPAYRRHVGIGRQRFHRRAAEAFTRRARQLDRPDVIVSALPTSEVSAAAVAYGERNETPVILDVRDIWPDALHLATPRALRFATRIAGAPMVRRLRRTLPRAAGITAVSASYLQWGCRHAGRAATDHDRVFPLGYQRQSLTETERRAARQFWEARGVLPDNKFRCCFAGVLGQSTDLRSILAVARRYLATGRDDVQFVLCGDGPRRQAYQHEADGLPNVVFAGWVGPSELRALFEMSTVGLAPYSVSAAQSLPNKPIEYLSAGLPVVASLRGELGDLLADRRCGATYDADDSAGLNACLERFRGSPDSLAAARMQARLVFEATFDASIVYPQMIDFLQEHAASRQTTERSAA